MSSTKPVACLSTPTPESRLAFLKAVYAAGFKRWCGFNTDELTLDAVDNDGWPFAYVSATSPLQVYFGSAPHNGCSPQAVHTTIVNSTAHFISYAKRP